MPMPPRSIPTPAPSAGTDSVAAFQARLQELAALMDGQDVPTGAPTAIPGTGMAAPPAPMGAPEMALPPALATPPEMPQVGVTPDIIKGATAKLVAVGRLDQATADLTPPVVAALQEVADEAAPGLYDLSNPQDLAEVIRDAALGTLPIGPRPVRTGQPGGGIPSGPSPSGGIPSGGIPGQPGLPGLPG